MAASKNKKPVLDLIKVHIDWCKANVKLEQDVPVATETSQQPQEQDVDWVYPSRRQSVIPASRRQSIVDMEPRLLENLAKITVDYPVPDSVRMFDEYKDAPKMSESRQPSPAVMMIPPIELIQNQAETVEQEEPKQSTEERKAAVSKPAPRRRRQLISSDPRLGSVPELDLITSMPLSPSPIDASSRDSPTVENEASRTLENTNTYSEFARLRAQLIPNLATLVREDRLGRLY